MDKQVNTIKKKITPILKKYGVKRASIFGSYARGEETKKSDVDLLVELGKEKGLFALIRMERELKNELGRKVDLLTYRSVHPRLKQYIFKDMIKLYEKR